MLSMKFLSPDIAKLSKVQSEKSLAKQGVSCGIFQDCFDSTPKNTYKNIKTLNDKDGNRK